MDFTRRDTLALTAGALLAATPALALKMGESDARLVQLERRYNRIVDYVNTAVETDEEGFRAVEIECAIDEEILATPATGYDGLMVKWRRTLDHVDEGSIHADRWIADFEAELARVAGRLS